MSGPAPGPAELTEAGVDHPGQRRHLPALPGPVGHVVAAEHQGEPEAGSGVHTTSERMSARERALLVAVGALGGPAAGQIGLEPRGARRLVVRRQHTVATGVDVAVDVDHGDPTGADHPAGVDDDRRQQGVDVGGAHQLRRGLERVESRIVQAVRDAAHLFDGHAVDLADLVDEQIDERVVRQFDHELVDRLAAVALEDVDADDVAAHRADATGDLAERTGTIGFRAMVGMWCIMLLITVAGWVLYARKRVYETGWFLRLCTWSIPVGYVAVTAGWITTEVGRQPWVVYNQLRTADAVTPNLTTSDVALSLALYVVVYAFVFGAGIYYLVKLVRAGPATAAASSQSEHTKRPARPLSAAE